MLLFVFMLMPVVSGRASPAPTVQGQQAQDPTVAVTIRATSDGRAVDQAVVRAGAIEGLTDAKGEVVLRLPAGELEIVVGRFGYEEKRVRLRVGPDTPALVAVELRARAEVEEEVLVTAGRTERRIQDAPLRVEVVDHEEVDEKLVMTPGDIAMLLNETNGLRVQVTSPSLGAANVRINGLSGRYTQILADGLPLYGGQASGIGLLQIPPMDLAQVEIVKGVASALYGSAAMGGVVNLVSRRPAPSQREGELLLNRTSRGGTDASLWLLRAGAGQWGYTFLGGVHGQEQADVDDDGWADLAGYKRVVARPRLFWDNRAGRSLLVAAGATIEERRGGTMTGRAAPDGQPFPERLDTVRFDTGIVGRFVTAAGRLLSTRASLVEQRHVHRFGDVRERDRHQTAFGEVSYSGVTRSHTWVVGTAAQGDVYRSKDVRRFDYTYGSASLFAQDDVAPAPWMTLSASARVDAHNEFGLFANPRFSALARPGGGWTIRVSGGTGYFAPTPFVEETEAAGLSRIRMPEPLDAERAWSVSTDIAWRRAPLEVNGSVFHSSIDDAVVLRGTDLVNSTGKTRTSGGELLFRLSRGPFDLIATHTYIWATESDPESLRRREVELNPRHTAMLDLMWKAENTGRAGLEFYYTGRQQLDDNPYRGVSRPYLFTGAIVDWPVGAADRAGRRLRVFVNAENLSNVRQTRYDPLVRRSRTPDGRWTVSAWAPLDGRVVNAGLRVKW